MVHWKITTLLICVYGIVKEFRPATPFITPYLVSHFKNLSTTEVYGDVYPCWTYSYLAFMVPVFFLTDILRYKPVIVLEALTLAGTWALLVWGHGVRQMQLMQIVFGLSSAAELAYYSYMYAMVNEKNYKTISSYVRSAAMVGKLVAFSLAQVLISTHTGDYLMLNQISFAAVALVTLIAVCLPSVPSPTIDKRIRVGDIKDDASSSERNSEEQRSLTRGDVEREKLANGVKMYFVTTIRSLDIYHKNRTVLKWSVWWALASCGYYQVGNYVQTLWVDMQSDIDDTQNGIAEIANTLTGAILAFGIQYVPLNWRRWGGHCLWVSSLVIAGLLLLSSYTHNVFVAYAAYVGSTSIYHMLITAASTNIAAELTAANYGMVFGCNTFAALILQSILTLVVADSRGFNLDIRIQFRIYSAYFLAVSVIFVGSLFIPTRRSSPPTPPVSIELS